MATGSERFRGIDGGHEMDERRPVLCPFCGASSLRHDRCETCSGLFDPLSRQATQNHMGPWYIRDIEHPFRPGCSYAVIRAMAYRGKIGLATVVRGPTTRQFWELARRIPGIANLLGVCHACQAGASPEQPVCVSCGVSFATDEDRQYLGLGDVRELPPLSRSEGSRGR